MKRQAPKDGYDFGNKRQYRRDVWSCATEIFKGQVADKKILIMPSSEGDEVEVALNKGFRQKNIFICDKNPAIVAVLKRKYLFVNTYGVSLSEAIKRIGDKNIKLDAINADLCGPIGKPLFDTIDAITKSNALSVASLFFLTILRGREKSGLLSNYKKMIQIKFMGKSMGNPNVDIEIYPDENDSTRLEKIIIAIQKNKTVSPSLVEKKIYKSSCGQTMMWFCFMLISNEWLKTQPIFGMPQSLLAHRMALDGN